MIFMELIDLRVCARVHGCQGIWMDTLWLLYLHMYVCPHFRTWQAEAQDRSSWRWRHGIRLLAYRTDGARNMVPASFLYFLTSCGSRRFASSETDRVMSLIFMTPTKDRTKRPRHDQYSSSSSSVGRPPPSTTHQLDRRRDRPRYYAIVCMVTGDWWHRDQNHNARPFLGWQKY